MLKAFFFNPETEYCESVADGSRYVDSPDNPYWETEKWHQLWVLTWRVKCHMGLCGEDGGPVVAYQNSYELKHPLDNSASGYLARISGLEKDEAETVIAVVNYLNKVNNYDPTMAYAFSDNKAKTDSIFVETSSPSKDDAILSKEHTHAIRKEEEISA